MRRAALLLTAAQIKLLRGAVRSHKEDMTIAGLWSETDVRMAEDILEQLDLARLTEINTKRPRTLAQAVRQAFDDMERARFAKLQGWER